MSTAENTRATGTPTGATPVASALDALRSGSPTLVVDDATRGSEGVLVLPCQLATPAAAARLAALGAGGPLRLALEPSRAQELGIGTIARENDAGTDPPRTIQAREGRPSALERTMTAVIDPATQPDDLVEPGVLAPMEPRAAGVLERAGHAEAALDLVRLAGLVPAAVYAPAEPGSLPDVSTVSVAELIAHRLTSERSVRRRATARLPTTHGEFTAVGYETTLDDRHHLALVLGEPSADEDPPLVRVHAERLLDDRFDGWTREGNVTRALEAIAAAGRGVFVYVARSDRGLGALTGQTSGAPQAQLRDYGIGAQILVDLGLRRIRLLTDHPRRIVGLDGYGLEVAGYEPLTPAAEAPEPPAA